MTIRNQSDFAKYALMGTSDLEVYLEGKIANVGDSAFCNSGVTQLVFADTIQQIPDRDNLGSLPNLRYVSAKGLAEIGTGVFTGCSNLQKLELPFPGTGTLSNTSNFGELFGTAAADGFRAVTQYFENGKNKTYYIPSTLTELVLSEGCEMIPYGGLYNCNMLEKVTLPTTLYMVGDKAFYGCAKLTDIYCKGADPAVAYDGTFEGVRVSSCKLHIPYNTSEQYKRSTGWKNFYYFEEEAPLAVTVAKTIENGGVIYGLNEYQPGQTAELKAVANSGYTFNGWMEGGSLLTTDATYSFVITDSRALTAWFAPVMDGSEAVAVPSATSVELSCPPVEGAVSYIADVYDDEAMTQPVLTQTITPGASGAKVNRAAATGDMKITLDGLNPEQQYYFSIRAMAAGDIVLSQFAGSFVTTSGTGIDDVATAATLRVVSRHDANGRALTAPVRGLNILRMSDGTVRKVLVK